MSDSLNNKELVAVGHQFAKAMSSDTAIMDIAKMVSRLAERLDCTTAALREMTKKRDAEHADVLVWEKTMFKVCGEDGPKSVADKFAELQAKCAALAAELESKQKDLEECAMDKVELSGSLTFTTLHHEARETELNNALCELLPGTQYMDPPDGGSVTPLEQVSRMVADYRQHIADLEAREVVLPDYTEIYQDEFAKEVDRQVRAALKSAGIITKVGE